MDLDRSLSAYDYTLPETQIAQNPAHPRDHSRLMVISDRSQHRHQHFYELEQFLQPGDLLVMNNTRVIPARLYGHKPTGSQVEVLLLEEKSPNQWLALVKPGRKLQPGAVIEFTPIAPQNTSVQLAATILDRDSATGGRLLEFRTATNQSLLEVIEQYGHMPLPPYIQDSQSTPEQYQTVYGDRLGSAAAPTAGLHFTPELLERLTQKGVDRTFVTLHVGVGTFRPVEVEDITQHEMHGEWIEVPAETVEKVRQTQINGGRVIAVGTTSARSLEGASQRSGKLEPYCGKTEIFIYPGYDWKTVDGMITNFHLPKSSLMMMISALIGRQRLLDLYAEAIRENYRFYSFGDAMLILPEAKI
ncbi:tRNA preQ1(34) S-adenosylmethionine ribosyltransferase-isomerase QueA [Alkalinema sp. FACHB-956]|uniref:tRNA preQ1(34) S-adenosylmethionine ribosyltransferase-isomerase QueA n=1 Tax=Alkalinema sp. FACHB-956 TaxID=2692768 RepID=UPI0016875E42|nr:tRNA preQ1(34) S-adenosylmethionine ribosyltransferase-isomerase QueA [Alkalinema sp. FACHB-956]MBD2327847.1 tRNA preQ1(34) S-adenosylmethionine ribosyltransferase-isomerase QueA [Alkalinema sp. FACHB-956]